MIADGQKTNRLLWGLIVVSVGVHLLMLVKIAGWYRFTVPVAIELDLRSISPPPRREIPRPAPTEKPKAPAENIRPLDPLPAAPPLEPLERIETAAPPDPMRVPEIPQIEDIDIAVWKGKRPEASLTRREPEDLLERKAEDAAADYRKSLSGIIPKIQRAADELYERKAAKRRIEGRTVVRLRIDPDGGVAAADVVESSGHRLLDQIAVRAVSSVARYPAPPGGPLEIDIPIMFKMI